MSTHASHYDIPVSFVSLPGSIRMLAKKELFKIPLLGQAMAAAEFPSIDRSNRQNAVRDLDRARAMMASATWRHSRRRSDPESNARCKTAAKRSPMRPTQPRSVC